MEISKYTLIRKRKMYHIYYILISLQKNKPRFKKKTKVYGKFIEESYDARDKGL